jgi:hypothetical protein
VHYKGLQAPIKHPVRSMMFVVEALTGIKEENWQIPGLNLKFSGK